MIAFHVIRRKLSSPVFHISNRPPGMCSMKISKRIFSSLTSSSDLSKNDNTLLERLDHRDWLAPNEVLKVFKGIRDADQIVNAFEKASSRNDYKPNEELFSLIIDKLACARRFDDVEDLLERLKTEKCKLSDIFFYKLIKIYVNVANHPERAVKVLLSMSDYHCWPSIKTFNLVLNMLVCNKHYELIHEIYLIASRLGIAVDTCCFNILIKGLCKCDKLDAAFSLLQEIPKQGCKPNATTYSTLMHALCKNGRVDEAIELCEEINRKRIYPDTITFNILISGLCNEGRVAEGMEFLKKMKLMGCYPNSATYQALLYGLLSSQNFLHAKNFMDLMISERACPSFLSFKLLIHGLCKQGSLNDVELVLKQMLSRNFIPKMGTWKKIIACAINKSPVDGQVSQVLS